MAYKIGQILFVAPKGKPALVPIQVVKEIAEKTLTGTVISYMVSVKSTSGEEVVDLKKVGGELFETADAARKVLIQRAVAGINQIVDKSLELAQMRFPNGLSQTSPPANVGETFDDSPAPDELEETLVLLDDGTRVKANIHLPESLK